MNPRVSFRVKSPGFCKDRNREKPVLTKDPKSDTNIRCLPFFAADARMLSLEYRMSQSALSLYLQPSPGEHLMVIGYDRVK